MPTLKEVTEKRAEILRLADRYRTSDVRIFGSVVRGNSTSRSDVDFLIKTKPGCSLFDLGGLREDLQDLLASPVDVVPEDALKPNARVRILSEAIPL